MNIKAAIEQLLSEFVTMMSNAGCALPQPFHAACGQGEIKSGVRQLEKVAKSV